MDSSIAHEKEFQDLMKSPIRKQLLQARIQKQEILQKYRSLSPKKVALQTLAPIPHCPAPGHGFTFGKTPQLTHDKWWDKNPTLAGEGCSEIQQRLSDPESFSGYYKRRFEVKNHRMINDRPPEAAKLLIDTGLHGQNSFQRSADFNSSVTWRLQLRPV